MQRMSSIFNPAFPKHFSKFPTRDFFTYQHSMSFGYLGTVFYPRIKKKEPLLAQSLKMLFLRSLALIHNFLSHVGPGNIPLFSTYRTMEFTYLSSDVHHLFAVCLQSALTIRTVEAIDFLDCYVYNLHFNPSLYSVTRRTVCTSCSKHPCSMGYLI